MIVINKPFDILPHLGKKTFNEISTNDKRKNAFIINRMLSRTLPNEANEFNHRAINVASSLDVWNLIFKELNKSYEGKKIINTTMRNMRISMAGAKKKKVLKYDKEIAKEFMRLRGIGTKDFQAMLKFDESNTIKYLKRLKKMIDVTD